MDGVLIFDNKKYISAKIAANNFGYSSDYIGQLCRAKKVTSRLVGRSWYVLESDLIAHQKTTNHTLPEVNKKISSLKKHEPIAIKIKNKKTKSAEPKIIKKTLFPDQNDFLKTTESRLSEIDPKIALYSNDNKELFPNIVKKVDFESLKYVASDAFENIQIKPKKPNLIENLVKKATLASVLVMILNLVVFGQNEVKNLLKKDPFLATKNELAFVYEPYTSRLSQNYQNFKNGVAQFPLAINSDCISI
jgi:hypothetical protein